MFPLENKVGISDDCMGMTCLLCMTPQEASLSAIDAILMITILSVHILTAHVAQVYTF
jgi:hypothetical protein